MNRIDKEQSKEPLKQLYMKYNKIKEEISQIFNLRKEIQEASKVIKDLNETTASKKIEEEKTAHRTINELKEKMVVAEEKAKQYKDKIAEIQRMKQTLSKLQQDIIQKDNEINNLKQQLKQTKEKIIITTDNELIAKQYTELTIKNQELRKGLDYHIKHKQSLANTYESINNKK